MSRIVLDTNSLIQSIPSRSKFRPLWDSFFDGTNHLCVSTEILNEYEEILQRLAGDGVAKDILGAIINNPYTVHIEPSFHFMLIEAAPDDNKFVDCAVAANAKYLVTEDKHYNVLRQVEFPHVDVVGIEEFLQTL